MLEETFGIDLALKYNLSGKGSSGKKSFYKLRLYKTIFCKFYFVLLSYCSNFVMLF